MKNLYFLLVVLLISIGATGQTVTPKGIDSSEKSNHHKFSPQNPSSHSPDRFMKGNSEWEISGFQIKENPVQSIKNGAVQQEALIQIYDSIYYWFKDDYSNEMKIYSKAIPEYDNKYNMISKVEQLRYGNTWDSYWLYTATYDANNNKASELNQVLDGDVWLNDELKTYTYDNNDNLVSILTQRRGTNNELDSVSYITYAYDNNKNLTTCTEQIRIIDNLINYRQYFYEYDAKKNNLTSLLTKGWDGSMWQNVQLNSYIYDVNNNLDRFIVSRWYGNWYEAEKNTYSYDTNNNLITDLYQMVRGASGWWNSGLNTYTYDINNNKTSNLYHYWNDSVWVNQMLYTYAYDNNNNQVNNTFKNLRDTIDYFTNHNFTFDENNFTVSSATQISRIDGSLRYADSIHYYFHTVISGINDLNKVTEEILIFPNPANNFISLIVPNTDLKNALIVIYNADGQPSIVQQLNEGTKEINVGMLPKGIYFVRVIEDKKVRICKFLKQ